MENSESTALVKSGQLLPKVQNVEAIKRSRATSSGGYVPHLTLDEVQLLAQAVKDQSKAKFKDRNSLLVKTLFDACLRCSEALGLRPMDIIEVNGDYRVRILGKGNKYREAAISASLIESLRSYARLSGMKKNDKFWPFSRRRVHQMIKNGMEYAGIRKPDHVGAVHVLRHTGAIARVKITGNPKSVQDQLGHSDASMTLRYLKTVQKEESLEIQGGVDFQW